MAEGKNLQIDDHGVSEEKVVGDVHFSNQERRNKYATACAVIASMISILMGYDTGVMSGAMLYIKDDLHISEGQTEVLAGIINVCALVGSLTAGRVSDWIGRRYTIALASVILFLGSIIMGLAPNFAALLAGRCVAGIGVGYALMIAPVYSTEISASSARGLLTSLPELCISFGILLGYISNYFFAKLPLIYGWRAMLAAAAVPSVALAIGVFFMPESPRWLVMQGHRADARRVLLTVSNSSEEAERRLADIEAAAEGCTARGKGVWKDILVRPTPAVRRIIVAALGIHFFQHATGIEAVVLYSPRIFKLAGLKTKNKLLMATVGVGLTKTCFIFVPTLLLDRVGRRPLLLSSVAGMILSLAALGFGLTMAGRVSGIVSLCIATVYLFVACYSAGLGPITWVYSSEIWPLRLRAQGASMGVAVNRLMNGVVSMTFISLYHAITIGGAFFMFAGIAVVAWLFFFTFYPETRGRSLEEMEQIFSKGGDKRREVDDVGCEMAGESIGVRDRR